MIVSTIPSHDAAIFNLDTAVPLCLARNRSRNDDNFEPIA